MIKCRIKKTLGRLCASKRFVPSVLLIMLTVSTAFAMTSMLNTYEIYDGTTVKTVHSYSSDEMSAINMAGYDVDMYELTDNNIIDAKTTRLNIQEKFGVQIVSDGNTVTAYTIDKSVQDILSEQNIAVDELDEVEPSLDTVITEEQLIRVVRVDKITETSTEIIPYQTVKRTTNKLLAGETRVAQEGVDGEVRKTVEITLKDGEEASREMINEQVLREPQPLIMENGTGGAVVTRGGDMLRYKKAITVTATAYSTEGHKNKLTASGTKARVGAIAVDPKVIPLGSRLYITSADGKSWIYGTAVAEDTGGKIKGNKIDLYFNSQSECINFGIKKAKVYVL